MQTRRCSLTLHVSLLLVLAGVGSSPGHSTPLYRIDDIGFARGSTPLINNSGHVVFTQGLQPVRYRDGIGTEPLSLPGSLRSLTDLNNHGQFVGTTVLDGQLYAFRYTEGKGVDALVPYVGAVLAFDVAINDLGHFVGNAGEKGFLYRDPDLLTPLPHRAVHDINNRGDILVGDSQPNPLTPTGDHLYTEARGWQEVRSPFFDQGGASQLNDRGQMVGFHVSYGAPINVRLVDVDTGATHDIGSFLNTRYVLSGLNNAGQAIGVIHGNGPNQPFIAAQGAGMRDLNAVIDPSLGWNLTWASDINDQGQIVGVGELAGAPRVFRLTPTNAIPEPGTMALLAAGLLPLARRRRP